MKRQSIISTFIGLLYSFFLTFLIFLLFWQCQKEYSFEGGVTSKGKLLKDGTGNCLPVQVGGIFSIGHQLADSNFLGASISVTRKGMYSIKTDTINGYSFSATGSFADTGIFSVKLKGSGKPIAMETDIFTIFYDSSNCNAMVIVKDSSMTTNHAVFTLQGAPDACIAAAVSGGYVNDVELDTSDYVKINLDVTSSGYYSITTDTVNGYYFSATGNLTATGSQQIILTANGTPLQAGSDIFTVKGGGTSCTFSVKVLTTVMVTNNDHFPLTTESYWVYDDLQSSQDSVVRQVLDSTVNQGGNQYNIVKEQNRFGTPIYYNYRKTGSDYFQYDKVDFYTGSIKYSPSIYGDIPFLKENLSTGDSWESPVYSGSDAYGQVILLKYIFNCLNANATVVLGGQAFAQVYIITLRPQISSVGNSYNYTGETYTLYFAKGVGLIYEREINMGSNIPFLQIRSWLVN